MRSDAASILMYLGHSEAHFRFSVENNVGTLQWFSAAPQPTEAEIDAAALPAARHWRTADNRAECSRRIFARYPTGRQLSALAGLYPPENVQAMTDWIAANIAAENAAADLIDAATTIQAVEAVTVAWPV